MRELLERIAVALEANVALAKEAQTEYRANAKRAHADTERTHKLVAEQTRRGDENAKQYKRLLDEQVARNEERDRLLAEELVRLQARDDEQTELLKQAQARAEELHELTLLRIGARAPETVPPDWTEGDAE